MRAVGQLNVKFGSKPWPGHGVIAGAAGVVEREHDLGHGGARHGLHHLGAGADDAFALGLRPDHEARNILQVDQRLAEPLAGLHEVRHLAGGFGIDDAADARTPLRLQESAAVGDDRRPGGPHRRALAHSISGAYSG